LKVSSTTISWKRHQASRCRGWRGSLLGACVLSPLPV